jgi:hypothetical protein
MHHSAPIRKGTCVRGDEITDVPLDILTGIGSAAVAAAVAYAGVQSHTFREQLKLAERQAAEALLAQQAQNDLALETHILALDRLFIERPALRKYFYEKAPIPTDEPHRSEVLATGELIVDVAEAVANVIRLKQLTPEDEAIWATALEFYGRSPAVREVFESFGAVWRAETRDLLYGAWQPSQQPFATDANTVSRARSRR